MARGQYLDPQVILEGLKEILRDSGDSTLFFFTEDVADCYDVHPVTAWRKLSALRDMGHIEQLRRKGAWKFTP